MGIGNVGTECPGCGEMLSVPVTTSTEPRNPKAKSVSVKVRVDEERWQRRLAAHLADRHGG